MLVLRVRFKSVPIVPKVSNVPSEPLLGAFACYPPGYKPVTPGGTSLLLLGVQAC